MDLTVRRETLRKQLHETEELAQRAHTALVEAQRRAIALTAQLELLAELAREREDSPSPAPVVEYSRG